MLDELDELDELLLEQSKMESEFETLKNGKASLRHFLQHQGSVEFCKRVYSSVSMPMHLACSQ